VTLSCLPASGSTFAIGTTTVHCTATSSTGYVATGSFDVTVRDTTPPVLLSRSDHSERGLARRREVSYSATATDTVDPSPTVRCLPASGSIFAIGTTIVQCTATDAGAGFLPWNLHRARDDRLRELRGLRRHAAGARRGKSLAAKAGAIQAKRRRGQHQRGVQRIEEVRERRQGEFASQVVGAGEGVRAARGGQAGLGDAPLLSALELPYPLMGGLRCSGSDDDSATERMADAG
jgi:hypothetical protein